VKKSQPAKTFLCRARKSFHVVTWLRLGAGAIPCLRKMFLTV
jgi:hypothetical protein